MLNIPGDVGTDGQVVEVSAIDPVADTASIWLSPASIRAGPPGSVTYVRSP